MKTCLLIPVVFLLACGSPDETLFGSGNASSGVGGASASASGPASSSSGTGGIVVSSSSSASASAASSSSGVGGAASSSSSASATSSSASASSSSAVSSSASSSSSSGGGPYYPVGVQMDVPPSWLVGWSLCYQDTYDVTLQSKIPQIKSACTGNNLLLACKQSAAQNFQVLAAAPAADVFFDTGPQNSATHTANGVQWYYNSDWSWGFAPTGVPVWQMQCDINAGKDRLCWLTVANAGGWRCGDNLWLNAAADWQRFVFQK